MQASIAHPPEEAASSPASLLEDERWKLVSRIAASQVFSKSPRLAHLLTFLCEQAILNHTALLTEQNIADKVFDRRGNFNPVEDTIVRSHMLRLRQRLEAYFREEGHAEHLRIAIPKGGYLPVFEEVPATVVPVQMEASVAIDPSVAPETLEIQNAAGIARLRNTVRKLGIACILLSGLLLAACAVLVVLKLTVPTGNLSENTPKHQLWGSLFGKNQRTIVVAADSGIVMLHGATSQNTTLSEYLSRDFSKELAALPPERREEVLAYAGRRYTSFVDLELIDRLTHVPEVVPGNYSIRFARDISVNDLKTANVIFSGSQDANPWLELFEPQMNFVLDDNLSHGLRGFSNRAPLPGESSFYRAAQNEYGVLAFLPNLSGIGNVLIVEGTSVAGTQAISDFLFMDNELDSFLGKIARKDGTIPRFEILLESRSLGGSASRAQILAYRTH